MNFVLIISLIIFSIGGMFSCQRQLQMFQQNSYYPSRYFNWAKSICFGNYKYSLLFLLVALCCPEYILPVYASGEMIYRIYLQRKNKLSSIKKLVYTGRVKRLIFTQSFVYIILIALTAIFKELQTPLAAVVIALSHFPQGTMFAAFFINKPIEKSIANYYINDAKRILKQNQSLITIAVTGSYGKTSVKFILNRILSEKFNTLATPESFNTPMGIVRTVRESMAPSTEIFIAEMGAKNIGDIKELCDICNPIYGIITAVGEQHLETFKNINNVAKTKFELADCCLNKENGKIYVNYDSPAAKSKAESLKNTANIISFGTDGAAATAENVSLTTDGTQFDMRYKDKKLTLSCKLLGHHNITNILGAAALALDLGVKEQQIRFAVSSLKAPSHRLELKPFINGATLIDDAYNSNPVGCIEAVNVLASFDNKKKIIVTPGLVELGEKEYEYNFNLGKAAAEKCDVIILVGKNRSLPLSDAISKTNFNKENLYIADSFADAMNILRNITDNHSIVLFENDLPDNYAG